MPITPARPVQVTATPHQQRQSQAHSRNQHQNQLTHSKPELNMDRSNSADPSQWLNFTLPPRRHVPGSGQPGGLPRRSKRGEGWRGSAVTRERFVQSNFRFVLKPTEVLSYGAHFADPDISLHWPHILQVLVPTFSAFSVAQGYVSTDPSSSNHEEDLGRSLESADLEGMGEEAAERRRRIEEERQGRMCPICLGKPVAGRMTKCGHIFCFPCILHFIQLSDIPKSARCPICGDTIHEGMLKSVKYLDANAMLRAVNGDDEDIEAGPSGTNGHDHSHNEHTHDHGLSHAHDHDHEHEGMVGEMDGFATSRPESARDADMETEPDRGHRIHMRLVQRPQMTTLALPTSATWPSDAVPPHMPPWHFLPDVLSFSRFMLATPDYMNSELQRELAELKAEWELMKGDALGREFVKAARDKVERQVGKVKAELMTDMVRRSEVEARENWGEAVGGERKEREKRRERERRQRERDEAGQRSGMAMADIPTEFLASQGSMFTPRPNVDIPPNLPVEPNPMPARKNRRRPQTQAIVPQTPPSPSYYFYQSSLGANVYLHPLDIRILLAHFKSYSLFPQSISFTSSGFDTGTINDELRKRCKYLAHLPASTEVVFVEADLEEIVGTAGLVAFEQPLKARRAKRRERVKREDRAKSRWEKAERDKLPPPTEDREFTMALARSTVEATAAMTTWSDPPLSSSAGSSSNIVPSFSPSTSPSHTVWGAHAQPRATFAHTISSAAVARPSVAAGRRPDPEYEAEVSAAWDAAFDRLNVGDRGGTRGGDGGSIGDSDMGSTGGAGEKDGGGGGGKRKGGKKAPKKVLVLGGGGGRRA